MSSSKKISKVLVLTSGWDEEYYIEGIFTSLEKLEEFKRKNPKHYYNDPEEHELDPE